MKRLHKICIFLAAATMLSSCELIDAFSGFLERWSEWTQAPITITLNSEKYNWDNTTVTDYKYETGMQTNWLEYVGNGYLLAMNRRFYLPGNIAFNLSIQIWSDDTTTCFVPNKRYTTDETVCIGNNEEVQSVIVDVSIEYIETGEEVLFDECDFAGWITLTKCPPEDIAGQFSFAVSDGDSTIMNIDGSFEDYKYRL